jgi:hypothetical protein
MYRPHWHSYNLREHIDILVGMEVVVLLQVYDFDVMQEIVVVKE